jgi:hypothetical protein
LQLDKLAPEGSHELIKEISRRRITVTSSLKEISTDQVGKRGEALLFPPPTLYTAGFWIYFKEDVNGFSSISDICFVHRTY